MVKTDAVLAELPAEIDVLLVDDSGKIKEADVEVLDEAAGFENTVEGGLKGFGKPVVLHADSSEFFVGHDHAAHHHDARGNGGEFVFKASEFLSGIHGFDEKGLEFLASALRFCKGEEALRRFRGFVLFLIVVFVCHYVSVSGDSFEPAKENKLPFAELRVKSPFYWMLTQSEHAVESNSRVVSSALIDGDAVDDVAFAEIFERPQEMLGSDAEHQGNDFVVFQFFAEAVDEVNFRTDGPLSARGRILDGFYNALGRADLIGGLSDLEPAFRVGDDANSGVLAADARDLLGREALVHRAVALPENDAGTANRFRRVSAKFLVGIPDNHLIQRDAHAVAGVAAKMFVGEKEHFFAGVEGPSHDGGGVGAGANRAAMLTGKGFDGRGRIHVGDRDDFARIDERR